MYGAGPAYLALPTQFRFSSAPPLRDVFHGIYWCGYQLATDHTGRHQVPETIMLCHEVYISDQYGSNLTFWDIVFKCLPYKDIDWRFYLALAALYPNWNALMVVSSSRCEIASSPTVKFTFSHNFIFNICPSGRWKIILLPILWAILANGWVWSAQVINTFLLSVKAVGSILFLHFFRPRFNFTSFVKQEVHVQARRIIQRVNLRFVALRQDLKLVGRRKRFCIRPYKALAGRCIGLGKGLGDLFFQMSFDKTDL